MLSELSQRKTNNGRLHFYEVSRIIKFTQLENRMVVTRGWEQWELVLSGYGVSAWEDEKVLEMDSDDCITLWISLMPLSYTRKSGENGQLYVRYISP